jgi:hypothetical protein
LLFVSAQHEKKINSIVIWKDYQFTASGKAIFFWRSAKLVRFLNYLEILNISLAENYWKT